MPRADASNFGPREKKHPSQKTLPKAPRDHSARAERRAIKNGFPTEKRVK